MISANDQYRATNMSDIAEKWNAKYRDADIEDATATTVLTANNHLLPERGAALEIACGLGGNARLLAERGLDTMAWDVSQQAIDKLQHYATQHQLPLRAQVRDVMTDRPAASSFDVIVVTYFLERELAADIIAALKPGGLLFYQTFIRDAVDNHGPRNPAFRLQTNELLQLFAPLDVVTYREEGRIGDVATGFRNSAQLIAVKTA